MKNHSVRMFANSNCAGPVFTHAFICHCVLALWPAVSYCPHLHLFPSASALHGHQAARVARSLPQERFQCCDRICWCDSGTCVLGCLGEFLRGFSPCSHSVCLPTESLSILCLPFSILYTHNHPRDCWNLL